MAAALGMSLYQNVHYFHEKGKVVWDDNGMRHQHFGHPNAFCTYCCAPITGVAQRGYCDSYCASRGAFTGRLMRGGPQPKRYTARRWRK